MTITPIRLPGRTALPEIEPFKPTAYPFRVKDYAAVFPLRADSAKKVDETKLSIVNHQPVIAGFAIYPSFMALNKGNYLWQPKPGTEKVNGYHAMCVIGYNDYAKTFEVMNSWGTGWGNDGYFEVSYGDYAKMAVYGYQITLDDRPVPNDPIKMTGDFELQKFVKLDTVGKVEIPIFQGITPTLANHEYVLDGPGYKKNDAYRLYAKNVTANCYIYVFSIDPENKAEILYPFSKSAFGELHNLTPGVNEVPRQYSSSVVEIPGHDNAIITDVAGNDSMCILYAYNPIDDITGVVNKVKNSTRPRFDRQIERGIRRPPDARQHTALSNRKKCG